jgi:DNA-binding GntR family transcriptional regulator
MGFKMPVTEALRSVREQILERLRDDILSGRIEEGERIGEVQLAKRFGVSRGPIREVLAQLTQEGLLVAKPNCGVRVAPSAPDSICELITPIRRTIEIFALKLIFDDLTSADFKRWDELLFRMERAARQRNVNEFVEQDLALHRSLLERSGQPDLLGIWNNLIGRIRRYFREFVEDYPGDMMVLYQEHVDLVAGLRSGDKKVAVQALEKHIF